MALDPGYLRGGTFGEWNLHGAQMPDAWEKVARGEAVTVSSNFVLHIGAKVGEPITLETPSGPLTVPVAGIATDFLSPRGTVKMSRVLYERLWHDSHITHAFVQVREGADAGAVRAGHRFAARADVWAPHPHRGAAAASTSPISCAAASGRRASSPCSSS